VSKVWFITGTSKGFGREWALAALERGDRVAATARDIGTLQDLVERHGDAVLPIELDVTDRAADFAAVARAHERFGRLDVVVNNAGYGHFGFVEEITEEEARAQLETNFFGALWVTQAALPFLREQRSGHVIQVSSIGGISAFPWVGVYHASKWALEGMIESLRLELIPFGVRVVQLRIGLVLGVEGGVLGGLLTPFEFGFGGPVGSGRQWMSWIHRDDVKALVLAAIADDRWRGAVNATAPAPVRNTEFARMLGRTLGRPSWLPVPALALRLALGEMSGMLLGGQRVVSAVADRLHYAWRHPDLGSALAASVGR